MKPVLRAGLYALLSVIFATGVMVLNSCGQGNSGDNSSSAGPDGVALYADNCASCHGDASNPSDTGVSLKGKSAVAIKNAIQNQPSMMGMPTLQDLTDDQITAIAAVLAGGGSSSDSTGNSNADTGTNTNTSTNTGTDSNTTTGVKTLTSISVTPDGWTRNPGDTVAFRAKGTYSDGSKQDVTSSVTWKSSDTGKVTIDSSGNATVKDGAGEGAVTITATLGGASGKATLNVAAASANYP